MATHRDRDVPVEALSATQGETKVFNDLGFFQADGTTPVSKAGHTYKAQIATVPGATPIIDFVLSTADLATGVLHRSVVVPAATPAGEYRWDLWDTTTDDVPVIGGQFTIAAKVTVLS